MNSLATAEGKPLVVLCAASNRDVMEAIRTQYEREYGRQVQVQYGPSQTLVATLQIPGSPADLFLPADNSYILQGQEHNLLDEAIPLAKMAAVVAVPKGNPRKIARWEDLLSETVKLAQGSVEATAIGKLTAEHLRKSGQWDPLRERTTVFSGTIHDVCTAVKVGAVDAGIVFDAVLHGSPELEALVLPELKGIRAEVGVAVTRTSKQPASALHFARYMSASDKGLPIYKEYGFDPVEGDEWAESPRLLLYAGAMLRPAIEETITAFEEREGVEVTRVYNGCGILVAQMQAGQVPDAYFACDAQFMAMVRELFGEAATISQNELVILVPKGNPQGITSLEDLGKPDIRVGVGHEQQCAMGWITQRTLEQGGVQTEVMKNVVVQTPTGDMLVNQMRAGSLDAAVAYLSNAAGAADDLDAIRITDIPCAIALQPYATAKGSRQKHLAARLLESIRAAESRERFLNEGFVWKADGKPASDLASEASPSNNDSPAAATEGRGNNGDIER